MVLMEPCPVGVRGLPGPGVIGIYLSFNSGDLTSTSSN